MQPTPDQLARFTADLHAKHDHIPGMARRIDRAAALAAAGDVRTHNNHYIVLSARNDGTGYHLDGRGRCTCPDFHKDAPQIRGVTFCKHRLAFNMVHRALVETLTPRILGNGESANRKDQEAHPNTFLLLINSRGRSALWSERDGSIAQVTWSRSLRGWMPASHADMVALDGWLSQAAPSPLSVQEQAAVASQCAAYDEMMANADSLPAWPIPAFRHWLNTGALPAYQQLDDVLARPA